MKKMDKDSLSEEFLRNAAEKTRKKAFRKNYPIVINENGALYLLDKYNKKRKIRVLEKKSKNET